MGFFSKFNETKIEESIQDTMIEVNPSLGLDRISERTAEKIVALNSAINLISNAIASLPVYLYKRDGDGERVKVDDNRNRILNASPSANVTAFNFKSNLIKNLVFKGNAYIYIRRDNRMNITSLEIIDNATMNITKNKYSDGSYDYTYKFKINDESIEASAYEVLNIIRDANADSPYGVGVLEQGARLLNTAKSEDEFLYSNLNGINSRIYLETAGKLSQLAKQNLKDSFRRMFSGAGSSTNIAVLEEGLTLKQLTNFSVADMKLLESKEFTNRQIALLLNIPFSYISDSSSSYNNSEQESIRFLQNTLTPYIRLIEESLNNLLLKESEKDSYFFEFKTVELLKSTQEQKIKYLSNAVNNGLMTLSEARRDMNLPHLDGADILLIPSSLAILDKQGRLINVNTSTNINDEIDT